MSTFNLVEQTDNYLSVNYDTSKIFIWNNDYEEAQFLNTGALNEVFPTGTVLGKVAATNQLVLIDPAAVDGSQYPVGILVKEINDLPAAGTKDRVDYCIGGDVAEEQIVLPAGVTLDDVIENKTLRDRLISDTKGIKLVPVKSLDKYDNA